MLAGHGLERGQAGFYPILPRGIRVQRLGVPAQAVECLARRDRRFFELCRGGFERGVKRDQLAQHIVRTRERRRRAAVLTGQQGLGLSRAGGQPPQAGNALAFLEQGIGLTLARVQRLQLRDVVPQQVEP